MIFYSLCVLYSDPDARFRHSQSSENACKSDTVNSSSAGAQPSLDSDKTYYIYMYINITMFKILIIYIYTLMLTS